MKIFLTGATGFLGSHTAEELVRRGHEVLALARKTSTKDFLSTLPIQWVEGSLPHSSLQTSLEEVEAVIHVAGITKALSPKEFFRVNTQGTKALAEQIPSLERKPKLFLQVSTIAVHSPENGNVNFCLPPPLCQPVSNYGKSKLIAEGVLEILKEKVRVIILRPPVLYGPRDKELLPLFKATALGIVPVFGDGKNEFSICHVSDVARALADLVESPGNHNDIFCLDDGEKHDWLDLAEQISTLTQKKPLRLKLSPDPFNLASQISSAFAQLTRRPTTFTPDKIKEMKQSPWVCGSQKLKNAIGWQAQVNFKEGAAKTLEFYKSAGWIR